MSNAPVEPLPEMEPVDRRPPTRRDISRATAISLVMVAALYAFMGVLVLLYISRGWPVPLEGTWRYYTFGLAGVLCACAALALWVPHVAAATALVCFFAVNALSVLEDPGSITHGAIVKVLALIILVRTMVQSLEVRRRSGR